MKLLQCSVKNFRIITDQVFKFTDGVNLIKGNNAQGKTTVLEAIYVFARGRSFRTRNEAEIISFDKDGAEISIAYEDRQRENTMSVSYRRDENRKLYKNGIEIKKTSEFLGNFRAVLFTPDHLSLIKSAATDRRLFLDIALSQIEPKYIGYLKKYSLLLTQRNALLKERNADSPESLILFETLAEQMAPVSAAITALRCRYCEKLTSHITEYFKDMTGGAEAVDTVYESCISADNGVLKDEAEAARLYERKFIDNLSREINLKT